MISTGKYEGTSTTSWDSTTFNKLTSSDNYEFYYDTEDNNIRYIASSKNKNSNMVLDIPNGFEEKTFSKIDFEIKECSEDSDNSDDDSFFSFVSFVETSTDSTSKVTISIPTDDIYVTET
jgi:hypothetical protein